MGSFTHLGGGKGVCVKCGHESSIFCQTDLLRETRDNSAQTYVPGEIVEIDGLDELDGVRDLHDFIKIKEWNNSDDLNIMFGDWECDVCGFICHSSIARFKVLDVNEKFLTAKFVSFEQIIPLDIESFNGIHFIESECAMIIWDSGIGLGEHPKGHLENYADLSKSEKIKKYLEAENTRAKHFELKHANKINA